MATINFLSGLGADERVFKYLKLNNSEKNYIKWITPQKNETISEYCSKLAKQIDTTKDNILICVSFGGIIGIELAKVIKFKKIIIISSIKDKYELPILYRIFGFLKLYKIAPSWLFKSNISLITFLFGVENQEHKNLLRNIIIDTNPVFLKWAISQILTWSNTENIDNLIHIHGDNDKILPSRNIKKFIKIDGGSHSMIVTKAEEINNKIDEILFS